MIMRDERVEGKGKGRNLEGKGFKNENEHGHHVTASTFRGMLA